MFEIVWDKDVYVSPTVREDIDSLYARCENAREQLSRLSRLKRDGVDMSNQIESQSALVIFMQDDLLAKAISAAGGRLYWKGIG